MITIWCWHDPSVLNHTPYYHGQQIVGDIPEAFDVARSLFQLNLNVMIKRDSTGGILIGLSEKGFGQQ